MSENNAATSIREKLERMRILGQEIEENKRKMEELKRMKAAIKPAASIDELLKKYNIPRENHEKE